MDGAQAEHYSSADERREGSTQHSVIEAVWSKESRATTAARIMRTVPRNLSMDHCVDSEDVYVAEHVYQL